MSRFVLNFIGFLLLTGSLLGTDFKVVLQRAEKGDVEAQYRLAEMYAEAQGVDQDYAKATQWARKASDQGNAKAQYRLASIIYTGENGQKRQPEALQLFLKSAAGLKVLAKEGDADAQSKLGILYARGVGVKKDLEEAAKLFEQAAKADFVKAQVDLGGAYLLGNGVARNPTTAGSWFEKAAKAGYGSAQIQFGLLNIQGTGCRQDVKSGLDWLKKASTQRHPSYAKQARDLLSRLQANPPKEGPQIDVLEKQAQGGQLNAQLELAQRYEIGAGVKVDFSAVVKWLNVATRQGSANACHRLGGLLMMGRGIEKNAKHAARYWNLAARLGHGGAQVDYAVASAKGDGVEKNLPEAYYWMLIARRGAASEEQQKSLKALQGIITSDLKPDQILDGLKRSRNWKRPEGQEVRVQIAGAEYGEPEAQLARGLAIKESRPIEALKWLRLAADSKVKGASKSVDELTVKLNEAQVEQAKNMAGEFKPLVP